MSDTPDSAPTVTEVAQRTAAAVAEISAAQDLTALEALRIRYLGRKGLVPALMDRLRELPAEQRREYGRAVNALKDAVAQAVAERKATLERAAAQHPRADVDWTLPGEWRGLGRLHPVTQIIERSVQIFRSLGFTVATGPDVETVYNNFDALNTPPDHPSRDPQDTFYLDNGDLLRCHTSPVQVRYMMSRPPPVRIVAPGRCYRRDTPDATHSANFHQIEGLYVDRAVSLADLKGDLSYFARELMGPDVRVRFRPHFFPFTEPSVEVDFSCHACRGSGCRICKQSGWIEIAGAGMVHPNVFRAVGYDPEEVSGYAFGMGIERIAMILFGIPDIRLLYENDLRYLSQF
ncbi:MAG: phenylalanine--tRNA ligase subunit alpha [Kiritimatiellae bacterium]|nr:phenylalanine--tRNA ligase subunit alpha [Kiritimatiellia bacterium]